MLEIVKLRIQLFYLFQINLQTVNEFQSELSSPVIFLLISQRISLSFTTVLKITISGEPLCKNFGVDSSSLSLVEWESHGLYCQFWHSERKFVLTLGDSGGSECEGNSSSRWNDVELVSMRDSTCYCSKYSVLTETWSPHLVRRTAEPQDWPLGLLWVCVGASAREQLSVLCWRLLTGGHANRGLLSPALVSEREREGNVFIW